MIKTLNSKPIITIDAVINQIKSLSSSKGKDSKSYFGIQTVNSFGLTSPQMKSIARAIGKDHNLALKLWKTEIHEARHIAVMIADYNKVTEKLMEYWVKDFNSWDIVDNCCGTLFDKTPYSYSKAKEWSYREKEFEKRAGFTMMATLAIHDKQAEDKLFEEFFPFIYNESGDGRNFVKKAISWAIRQIGKRNERLCKKAIALTVKIRAKGDSMSRWAASDASRELINYHHKGRIRNIGVK